MLVLGVTNIAMVRTMNYTKGKLYRWEIKRSRKVTLKVTTLLDGTSKTLSS